MRPIDRNALTWTVCVLVGIFVAGLAVASASDKPDPPVSPAAKAARKKFDAAVARANEVHRLAVLAATRTYVKELEATLRAAANSGKPDEVARIASALAQAKQEVDALNQRAVTRSAKAKTGRIYAAKDWQPALKVKQGQVLQIEAAGSWTVSDNPDHRSGPDGIDMEYAGRRYGTLLARVGDKTFEIGTGAEIEVPGDGTLEMVCHDASGGRGNNAGYVDVQIKVIRVPVAADVAEENN